VRTIVRDVQALRRRELEVPSRGQQQDIGPGQTHRVQAVRLFLLGHQPNEIARRLYHTLGSIENYVTTFARVVILVNKGYADDEIAFVMRRSSPLIAAYRKLYGEFQDKHSGRRRIQEILSRRDPGRSLWARRPGSVLHRARNPIRQRDRKTSRARRHLLHTSSRGSPFHIATLRRQDRRTLRAASTHPTADSQRARFSDGVD
jgi:hypothetical protein